MTMITLFGKPIEELGYHELRAEISVQRWFLRRIKNLLTQKDAVEKENIAPFLETYAYNLEALIADLNYFIEKRHIPLPGDETPNYRAQIRFKNRAKHKQNNKEAYAMHEFRKSLDSDDYEVSWNKDKFYAIASDRGYQTEEGILYAVEKELNLERPKVKMLLNRGRFTWGQVLCLGVMLEMTPKEFCDTFLAGYFVDQFGEYRASYDNLDKESLLKRAVKPKYQSWEDKHPIDESIVDWDNMEEIVVESSNEQVVEEEWFD